MGISERQNVFVIPSKEEIPDGSDISKVVLDDFAEDGEFICEVPVGEYDISVISLAYRLVSEMTINVENDTVVELEMEIDHSYRPFDDSDYLRTRGWSHDGKEWCSPHKTFKHFDTFLCAKFNEFLDTQIKLMMEDERLMELNILRHEQPPVFEEAMWMKYRDITHDDYNNFVASNIIDA